MMMQLNINPSPRSESVCIEESRIPTEVLALSVFGGDSVDAVAGDYGVSRQEVLSACWLLVDHARELPYQGQERRILDAWGDWSDDALTHLGGWDKSECPEPPRVGTLATVPA